MPSQHKKAAKRTRVLTAAADATGSPRVEATTVAQKATPEEYNAFIFGVELQNIRLAHCELKARARYSGTMLEARVEEGRTTFEQLSDGFLIIHTLQFSGVPAEGAGDSVVVQATFELEYQSNTPISNELFAVFRQVNLPVNIWPFFREFVHTVLARANWPVYVLPALRIPPGGPPKRHRTT